MLVAKWLEEAAEDIQDWGIYAAEYFREKYDLEGTATTYRKRAAAVREWAKELKE